jgi:hypothetical protein
MWDQWKVHFEPRFGYGISVSQQGFAIVNNPDLLQGPLGRRGARSRKGSGAARIGLGRIRQVADLSDPTLLAFPIVEEAIGLWFESKPLSGAFADLGGSAPLTYAAIFLVALIPFFASGRRLAFSGMALFGTCSSNSGESDTGW